MIARLKGKIVDKYSDRLVIDVGGVGYEVYLSVIDLEKYRLGDDVDFCTYHHIRENSQELFGFVTNESKQLFNLLLSVSGVGPKMAMNIMGLGEYGQISHAIAAANSNYVSGASGVGKRLADRVCVDLKDKVLSFGGEVDMSQNFEHSESDDALDALIGLGYSRSQAAGVLNKIDPSLPIEERIKMGLKEL